MLGENRPKFGKVGENAWGRLYSAICSPSHNAAAPHRELVRDTLAARSRNVAVLVPPFRRRPGRASIFWTEASFRAPGKTEFAGKWRRNGLKRLNPRREMVWPRKPRTHKI